MALFITASLKFFLYAETRAFDQRLEAQHGPNGVA